MILENEYFSTIVHDKKNLLKTSNLCLCCVSRMNPIAVENKKDVVWAFFDENVV